MADDKTTYPHEAQQKAHPKADDGPVRGEIPVIYSPLAGDKVTPTFSADGGYSSNGTTVTAEVYNRGSTTGAVASGSSEVDNQTWSVGFVVGTVGQYDLFAMVGSDKSAARPFEVVAHSKSVAVPIIAED